MRTRLLIASAALTAVVGLSASVAVSLANSNPDSPKAAAVSSTDASHRAPASAPTGTAHASQSIAAAVNPANAGKNPSTALAAGASSPSAPTLITVQGGAQVLARGAQKAVPVAVSEDHAMQAIFKGGMWLPNATGGREYAKYDHHLIHDDGDWTWVGKVQTDHGLQSAVITFGKDAVFGRIPQASGNALRLVTAGGQKLLVQTDGAKMAASALSRQLYARQDFKVPSHKAASASERTASASARTSSASPQQVTSAATASGGPTIDVMVAYTSGIVSAYGSASAAVTRINNLVDITNQAYSDSGVNQRVRLVHTMQVSYTDTNDNTTALDDITGNNGSGGSVPIPSSLQGVASARAQYGADLVVLLRHFNDAGNNGCGVGWLIGGGEQGIVPSEDNAFGYSVVQDGSDGGYFCLDSTFAHELGHNMGSAHDRAHADQPGAYSYSYGYLGGGSTGFSTIMAYGSDTQTPLDLFSNPNISKCENSPCGVADTSTSSADNVHSLNNTASLIAQFEATKVATSSFKVRNDVDGDGKSDLLFQEPSTSYFGWWLMNGTQVLSTHAQAVRAAGYTVVATGDFNGDGKVDIVWTNSAHAVYIWFANANGGFSSPYIGTFAPGWHVVTAGDVDGDGKDDLLFRYESGSQGRFGYWIMNGSQVVRTWSIPTSTEYRVGATGDFNGDGKLDIAWTSNRNDVKVWLGNGTSFSSSAYVGGYASGWTLNGAGDINHDGKSDLLFTYQSGSNARFGYWIMNGATLDHTWSTEANPAYRIVSTGDFNGDGYLDIAWTSSAQDIQIWTGNGTSFSGNTFARSYGADWQPVTDTP